jgi:protein-L-isoaspartate(D-aspartate) O-methyltransferase
MKKLLILFLLCIYLSLFSCSNSVNLQNSADAQTQEKTKKAKDEYKRERREMVEQQIGARGIENESVISAMMKVPRHKFVPDTLVKEAYIDSPLPIGLNQTISQPFIVAYMTDAADISKNDKVLEIGTGSGYQAAILGELQKKFIQ